ncbi:hypothetical protein, partial [Pseudoalteromonas sp. S1649]|uniref:hypothetical protein n=1 Tax=Pseudoalteromonas sp. S1649 TaxID=579508 RepID=UPI001BB256E4
VPCVGFFFTYKMVEMSNHKRRIYNKATSRCRIPRLTGAKNQGDNLKKWQSLFRSNNDESECL